MRICFKLSSPFLQQNTHKHCSEPFQPRVKHLLDESRKHVVEQRPNPEKYIWKCKVYHSLYFLQDIWAIHEVVFWFDFVQQISWLPSWKLGRHRAICSVLFQVHLDFWTIQQAEDSPLKISCHYRTKNRIPSVAWYFQVDNSQFRFNISSFRRKLLIYNDLFGVGEQELSFRSLLPSEHESRACSICAVDLADMFVSSSTSIAFWNKMSYKIKKNSLNSK